MGKLAKVSRSRELRRRQTKAEIYLWRFLRNRHLTGRKFRRQYVFKGFILDFYCAEDKIAIELDGPIHYKQKAYDVARQKIIEDNGIKVIRFKNEMVLNDINKVLNTIKSSFPSPSKMEKGAGLAPADEVPGCP
jgi:very-short-patch-repair endonuclease